MRRHRESRKISWRRRVTIGALCLVCLYGVLLWPESPTEPPVEETPRPFRWDRDDYWSALETRFADALTMDSVELGQVTRPLLARASDLLDSCRDDDLEPDSELFSDLEQAIFELAPLVAADMKQARRPNQVRFVAPFFRLHNGLRRTVKDLSRQWDLSSPQTRDLLYRLIYGSRTTAEEVLLQSNWRFSPLFAATDEPSATPAAEMLRVKLHSGDILVSRGGAATSALIARGNDYPGNFSHVALVHVDEATQAISIIESHIEIGVAVADVERYLQDTKLRILVLRLRADHPALESDPMLPHKAATLALERARNEHIPYDFEMDYTDNSRLFCSEVASDPYRQLGVTLWMGLSHISSPGVRSWLGAFGVKNFTTQEPSDLEYDPQLRVVAEWRDPQSLLSDHVDNAVIDAMLERAETGDRLTYDWYMLPLGRLLKAYSMLNNILGAPGPIPEGMSATAALTNDWFSRRHAEIKTRVLELAEDFHETRGYRAPYWELVDLARQATDQI